MYRSYTSHTLWYSGRFMGAAHDIINGFSLTWKDIFSTAHSLKTDQFGKIQVLWRISQSVHSLIFHALPSILAALACVRSMIAAQRHGISPT
jgi:hypothetical protein